MTGKALSLTKEKESDILVQHMSNIRSWVTAKQFYKIGGMDGVVGSYDDVEPEDRLNKAIKDWLKLGNGPKPKNVTRKKEQ